MEQSEWSFLHTLSLSSGGGRGGYELQVPGLSGGGGGVQVGFRWSELIVDRGIPHVVVGVIRHRLNHQAFGFPLGAPQGRLRVGEGGWETDLLTVAVMDLSAERLFIREL